ncbi:MAG: CDF family Co(II)/Ni(II) efflux transporter DmeF [Victivallaceae bacterium]
MHTQHLSQYQHPHIFSSPDLRAEKMTERVVYLTLFMMIAEIVAGYAYHSMALLADGWHMSTHTVALAIALLAFVIARRHADDRRYAFGTWKIEVLGGFTSGLILGAVGLAMSYVSIERLVNPVTIQYDQAILITVIGLGVNFLSAFMLRGSHHSHHHSHHDEAAHSHEEHSHEKSASLNLKAAYLHVIADAATSVFAIIALVGAKYLNWVWLDPLMGIAGAALILRWTYGLLKETGTILVDRESSGVLAEQIKQTIENDGETKISDLHLWKVGMNKYACIISLVTANPQNIAFYKQKLEKFEELAHLTIEINICTHP